MIKKFLSNLRFRLKVEQELKRVRKSISFPPIEKVAGIWAVTMARNEAMTLPVIIDHFKNQGISRVLVINHLSTDDTVEQLKKYGDFVQIAQYRDAAYEQRAVMTLGSR